MERLPFDLRDLLRGVSEIVAPRLAGRPVNLSVDFDPALPETLVGDPGRIRQVLLNLVGNAAKFTEQGSIAVSAEVLARDGDTARIRLAVGDTGIGIPKARQAELFTEFVSLDASHSRKYGGTGLGLAISRKLTRLMGGSIGFVSREGTGSRFWVELPLPVGSTPAATDPIEAAPVLVSADHARILLAEDNPTNTMVARIILENAGYHVDTAANGIEAVEAVRRFPYDAVLMDVAMPEMDGIAATAAIRAMTKRGRRVPVIAMTAYAASEFADRAAEAGFDDILPKPVNRLKMLAVLARFVATRPAGHGTGAAPAAAPVEDAPLIAEDRLAALAADTSADVLPDLIRSFLADSGNRIVAIRQGLANGDLAALEAAAHPLGSSSATFGALRLTDACRAVEAAARDGDAERATSLAADLLQLAEATRDAFAQRLGLARRAGDR